MEFWVIKYHAETTDNNGVVAVREEEYGRSNCFITAGIKFIKAIGEGKKCVSLTYRNS